MSLSSNSSKREESNGNKTGVQLVLINEATVLNERTNPDLQM
jgi:hypothetical protein